MTAPRRKRLASIFTFGTLLTALVLVADGAGYLTPLERSLYDARVRHFQFFAKPPTDKLLHVDVDDGALAQIGQWPWDRSRVAELIEELNRAGAKAVVLDILFSEAKEPELRKRDDGTVEAVDHDQVLADAIRRAGNVILAVSLTVAPPGEQDELASAMVAEFVTDLEITVADLEARLASRGALREAWRPRVGPEFLGARARAMAIRIGRELDRRPDAAQAGVVAGLLPKASAARRRRESPVEKQLREAYAVVTAARALRRFTVKTPGDVPPLIVAESRALPIAKLSEAASTAAFVDYLPEPDGVVRLIPLAAWYEGRVFPQISLAAACRAMDVDPRDVRVGADEVVIPRAGGDLRLPTSTYAARRFAGTGTFFDIPLTGRRRDGAYPWERMYDFPSYEQPKLRVNVLQVIAASETRQNMARGNVLAALALGRVLAVLEPGQPAADAGAIALPEPELRARVTEVAEELRYQSDQLRGVAEPTEDERARLAQLDGMWPERAALERFLRDESGPRSLAALHARVEGRVVFVGSVATGAYDFVPNAIDPKCPGVYLHSAAFNAIMTGEFWRHAPPWVTHAFTIVLGLLTTAAVAAFDPPKAFASLLLLCGWFAAVNGVALFDRYNVIVGAAGPLVTAACVWSGVTLIQFVREIGERTRLTRRFSSYVDPTLVNYVIENPEQARLEAREVELTVCFSDLAGFTTLSEKLRAKSAKVLGQYMEAMVPLIRARRGYVNKFLGDGIMFFCGAPVDNPDHAADAVTAVLDMQRALGPFNETLARQGLPTLSMRAGVSTGMMVVGDAGPSFATDYTVLGDAVNLAARIESANKAFGTTNLVTARTAELIKGRFLLRPIADLLVVGKSESCCVFEAVALAEDATAQQQRLAELTEAMFDAFVAARFDACLDAAAVLDRLAGPTKLTALYRAEAEGRRGKPPEPGSCGKIQLFTK